MTVACIGRWRSQMRIPGKTITGREAGFTMVEVLASIALLAIAVTPMMGLFTIAPGFHAQREHQLRASFLAQLRLEEVKQKLASDFGSADYRKSSGSSTDFHTNDGFHDTDSRFRYTLDYVYHDTNDDDIMDIADLKVIVWHDGDSDNSIDANEQWVELNTKVARRL